jgi:hypothetical protein
MGEYVPNGSYKKTSRNIKVTLSAECQKQDGIWQPSTLDITDLNQPTVENDNGTLKSVSIPRGGYVPTGSYQETSRNIKVILTAECQKQDGTWQPSTLDITNLAYGVDVANNNGQLTVAK